ncbi:phage portal protein, partial [Clostridium neonatale]
GIVPVGIGMIGGKVYNIDRGYEEGDKTIYNTIKKIQDALETNLSDIVCEISDFRNAILKMYGIEAENEKDKDGNDIIDEVTGKPKKKAPVVKDNCILLFGDKTSQDAEWLIKNVNDVFIKNTRDDLLNLIYTLTSHIDNNEKMQSNLSGMALRSKLQCLEAKCKMNEKAMQNIIYTRIYCLFKY